MGVSICTSVSADPWTVGVLTPIPAGAGWWNWTWDSGPGRIYHDVVTYDSGYVAQTPHQLAQTLSPPGDFGGTSGYLGLYTGAAWMADVWADGPPGTYCGTFRFFDSSFVELSGGPSPAFCAYGTEPISSVTGGVIVTTGLIDVMLLAVGIAPWVSILFDAFIGKILYAGGLCASPPPAMPVFTSEDFLLGSPSVPNPASLAKWWQGLQAVAWPYFCKCTPAPFGSPDPLPFPTPVATPPDGAPAGPVLIECEDQDVCTVLNDLARQLAAIQTQLSIVNQYTQLIQRTKAPYGYLAGVFHGGLSGAGQFVVQGILAVAVQVTTVPGSSGEESGDPVARFGLGWITSGTTNGWRKSVPIRHNPQWVDVEPDDTLIGFSFGPLVVADIQEFVREP